MKTKMTKTAACKQARNEVSTLAPLGGQWYYEVYDEGARAWRQSILQNYHIASSNRRRSIIERANEVLHGDPYFVMPYNADITGGKWENFVY